MRLEEYDKRELWKSKLSLQGKNQLDRRSTTRNLQYINTFESWTNVSSSWLQTNTRKIHERDKQTRLLEYSVDPCDRVLKIGHSYNIQCISMSYRCKFEHSHNHTNVDPCWYFIQYTPSQPGEKAMSVFNKYPGSLYRLPQSMILSMWLQWSEVKHGRNQLITDQWCKSLTSVREITIDVNDSQGTLVQSTECE